MYRFPIGVILESFRLPIEQAVPAAAKLGAQGLQVYARHDKMCRTEMNASQRRDFLHLVKDNGMVFSALCGDLGMGFGNASLNPELISESKRIMEIALEMETNIVTTHIGVVPTDPEHPRYKIMQDACGVLAEYADGLGAHFAIETGPEPAKTLKGFLDGLHSRGVAVNLDPANLCMVTGDDPVQAVYNLRNYIVHTHAKDGIRLREGNPEYIYQVVHPIPAEFEGVHFFEEVPLGTGSVKFPAYLKALEDIGYRGFLTIEREVGNQPEKDIRTAVDFLTKTIEEN